MKSMGLLSIRSCKWICVLVLAGTILARGQESGLLIYVETPSPESEPETAKWSGETTWALGSYARTTPNLSRQALADCLGKEQVPDDAATARWNASLFSSDSEIKHVQHRSVPVPIEIPGALHPRLWILEGNYYCVLSMAPEGVRVLARMKDEYPVVFEPTADGVTVGPEGWLGLPEEFAWERTPVNGERQLLLKSNYRTDGWRAEALALSEDGRKLRRLGTRQGGFDAFEGLYSWQREGFPSLFWSEGESNGRSYYCGLFSQAGGLERPAHDREIIQEELRLGRRLTENEAMKLVGGDACLDDENAGRPPETCGWLGDAGLEWGKCADRPGYQEFVASFKRETPEPAPDPPRTVIAELDIDPSKGLFERDDWNTVGIKNVPPEQLKECLGTTAFSWEGFTGSPYSLANADHPTLLVGPRAICMYARVEDNLARRMDMQPLKPALPGLVWVGWVPGSTVRYRYIVLAGGKSHADPVTDLRLIRLDLATGQLKPLDRLTGIDAWFARLGDRDEDSGSQLLIQNFGFHHPVDPVKDCLAVKCKPGDFNCASACSKLGPPEKKVLIIDHGKLVVKPYIPPAPRR